MAKYRVYAEAISNVCIEVEADNEDEAMDKAREIDGGEWEEVDIGDWIYGEVVELK